MRTDGNNLPSILTDSIRSITGRYRKTLMSVLSSKRPIGEFLRVLICIEALGIGGKERQAVELIKGLASKSDIECLVVCLETDEFYLHELTKIQVSIGFITGRGRWYLSAFAKIYIMLI